MKKWRGGQHIRNVYCTKKAFYLQHLMDQKISSFRGYFRPTCKSMWSKCSIDGLWLYPNGTGPGGYSQQPIPVNRHRRHKKSLETLANICGKFFYISNDPVTAIKDVNDMFLFDLNEATIFTPTQITVSIGGFPQLLIRNLREGASPNKNPENPKYLSYHGHRELMHGLGFMIGMKFQFEGLPKYNADNHFVQIFLWSPFSPRTAIKLDTCELECPLSDFTAIIESFIKSTGPWQDICSYHPVNMPVVKDTKPNDVYTDTTGNIKDAQVEKAGALWSL
ncbi:putative histidine phosphatase superfamily [Plasmopara halstedii]